MTKNKIHNNFTKEARANKKNKREAVVLDKITISSSLSIRVSCASCRALELYNTTTVERGWISHN